MEKKPLRGLFLYNGIFVLAGSLLGPLYAVYVGKFKGVSVSVSWAAFLFSVSVFTYLISRTGDRLGKKEYLLMAGFLVRAIAWMLFIFVDTLAALIALQILLGLGDALGGPSFDSLFASRIDQERAISQYSNWKLFSNVLTVTGTLAGGLIADKFGFQYLFLSMSALAMVSFFGVLFQIEEAKQWRPVVLVREKIRPQYLFDKFSNLF